jgi:hypothetical protein
VSCASIKEQVVYPDKISSLTTLPSYDNSENKLSASIDASIHDSWNALILVLKQRSFTVFVDRTSENNRVLAYLDRTALLIEGKPEVIEMPFQVVMHSKGDDATALIVICRWDLITSDSYQKTKEKRFEDLKKGMLSEAFYLINQVNTQATANKRWRWITENSSL